MTSPSEAERKHRGLLRRVEALETKLKVFSANSAVRPLTDGEIAILADAGIVATSGISRGGAIIPVVSGGIAAGSSGYDSMAKSIVPSMIWIMNGSVAVMNAYVLPPVGLTLGPTTSYGLPLPSGGNVVDGPGPLLPVSQSIFLGGGIPAMNGNQSGTYPSLSINIWFKRSTAGSANGRYWGSATTGGHPRKLGFEWTAGGDLSLMVPLGDLYNGAEASGYTLDNGWHMITMSYVFGATSEARLWVDGVLLLDLADTNSGLWSFWAFERAPYGVSGDSVRSAHEAGWATAVTQSMVTRLYDAGVNA